MSQTAPSTPTDQALPDSVGTVVTFYSYKGGVGRSMALANVAALLAREGKRILVVDWDLEAPGIEKYFREADRPGPAASAGTTAPAPPSKRTKSGGTGGLPGLAQVLERRTSQDPSAPVAGLPGNARESAPGMVDLITAWRTLTDASPEPARKAQELYESKQLPRELDWESCILECRPFSDGEIISVITAGRNAPTYVASVQGLDWNSLFARNHIGLYFERLRDQWRSRYDFVLIDSRTGLSDSGSICTALLPDQLVVFFTANEQSVDGVIDAIRGARLAQERLPVPRSGLLVVPVPSRDEPFNEEVLSRQWRALYARKFAEFYEDWALLPGRSEDSVAEPVDAATVLNTIFIPYQSYWSFGERLPVLDKDARENPVKIGKAYVRLATLIGSGMDWSTVAADRSVLDVERARASAQRAQDEAEAKKQELEGAIARAKGSGRFRMIAVVGVLVVIVSMIAVFLVDTYLANKRAQAIQDTEQQIRSTLALASRGTDAGAVQAIDDLAKLVPPDDPRLLDATQNLAKALVENKLYEQGIKLYQRVLETSKNDPIAASQVEMAIGGALAQGGKNKEAITRYENVRGRLKTREGGNPEWIASTTELTHLYEEDGDQPKARAAWLDLIKENCRNDKDSTRDCILTRCQYVRYLVRSADPDSKTQSGILDEAREESLVMLWALQQDKLIEDPEALNYSAALKFPTLREALQAYEIVLRARKDKAADAIANQLKRLESIGAGSKGPTAK